MRRGVALGGPVWWLLVVSGVVGIVGLLYLLGVEVGVWLSLAIGAAVCIVADFICARLRAKRP